MSGPPVVQEPKTLQEWQKEYEKLERDVTLGVSFEGAILIVSDHLSEFKAQKMADPVKNFFINSGLPRVTTKFLKEGPHFMSADQAISSHLFLRSVLDVIIEFGIAKNSVLLTESLFHLFDPLANFYCRCGKPPFTDFAHASAASTPPDGCFFVTDNINYFANQNGFKAVIDHLSNPNSTLQVFNNLINLIWKPIPNNYLLPELAQQLIPQVTEIIQHRLTNLSESEIRTIKKDDFEKLVRNIVEKSALLHQRLESSSVPTRVYIEDISLGLAKQCFFSQIFDKRLFGLSLFSDWVKLFPEPKKSSSATDKDDSPPVEPVCRGEILVSEQRFRTWARENKLIGALFGLSKHVNLIKQSGILLSYMASKDALEKEDLELIIDSIKGGHASVATEVLQLIGNIGQSLLPHHVEVFLNLVSEIDIIKNEGLAVPIVSFAASMARTSLQNPEQRRPFLQFLWKNVLSPERWSVCESSLLYLLNIFHSCSDFEPLRLEWARMLLSTAHKGVSASHCYQLLGNIVTAYPARATVLSQAQAFAQANPNQSSDQTVVDRQSFSKNLNSEQPILDQILSEFSAYKDKARAESKEKNIESNAIDSSMFGTRMNYQKEVTQRFIILELFLNLLGPFEKESWDQVFGRMWGLFVLQSLTKFERESGLQLFSRLRRPYEAITSGQPPLIAISDDATPWIFSLLLSLKPTDEKMNITTYKCYQQYFCDTNVIQEKMLLGTFEIPFLNVVPSDLTGYDYLWDLVLNSLDEEVVTAAIKFLCELHQFKQRSGLHKSEATEKEYNELFISICLSKLSNASDSPSKNLQIMRCLSLLTRFIDQTEGQKKNNSFQSHQVNRPISLTIVNRILNEHLHPTPVVSLNKTRKDRIAEFQSQVVWWEGLHNHSTFSLHVHNNFTISEIQTKIVEYLKAQQGERYHSLKASDIIIEFLNSYGRDDSDAFLKDHLDKTLEFHSITSDTEIAISVLPVISHRETYNRKASLWRTVGNETVSLPVDAEKKAIQVAEVCDISKEAALLALKECYWNVEAVVAVAFTDPSRIMKYESQARANGKVDTPRKVVQEEVPVDVSCSSWLIASNEAYFQQLFNLFKEPSPAIHPLVSQLLSRLPAAQHKHNFLFYKEKIDWESFFGDQNDAYSVLYHLQIIDAFLFHTASDQAKEKQVEWVEKLMQDEAISSLLKCVITQLKAFQPTQNENTQSKSQMECLSRLLRLTAFILESRTASQIHTVSGFYGIPFLSSVRRSPLSIDSSIIAPLFFQLLLSLKNLSIESLNYGLITPYLSAYLIYAFRAMSSLLTVSENPSPLLEQFLKTLDEWKEHDPIRATLISPFVTDVSDALSCGFDLFLNSVHRNPSLQSPLTPFLKYFIAMQPTDPLSQSTVSPQYYKLLCSIISKQIVRAEIEQLAEFINLADTLMTELKSGLHFEKTGRPNKILAGKIQILTVLLEQKKVFMSLPVEVSDGTFVKLLHDQFLFSIALDADGAIAGPLCTTRSTRSLVFNLLLVLCRSSRANYKKVVRLMSEHFAQSKPTFTSWQTPKGKPKNDTGYVGLKNLSATCYMNSLLQQFFNIKSIRGGILTADSSLSIQKTAEAENMLFQLQHVFGFLSESVMHHYDPVNFFNTYKDMDGRPAPKNQQQDVDEYFNRLCSELERLLAGTKYASLFRLEFGGVLSNEIKSNDPQYPWFSENPENFLCIPLDVQGKSSLEQALNALVAQDKLEGDNAYMCEKYGRKIDATKRYSVKSLSNLLTFSLKRFDYDVNLQRRTKINDYFHFPNYIDMRPWSQEGLHGNDTELTEPFPHREDWYYQYVLVGVVVHIGSCDSGHYYSFRKVNDNDWLEFNDSDVRPFNVNNLGTECFGGKQWVHDKSKAQPYEKVIEKSAYMLFYERVRKEVIDDYSAPLPENKNKATEAVVVKPETSEIVDPVVSRVREIPHSIHQSIWETNRIFLRDQYMLDPAYNEFALQLMYLLQLNDIEDDVKDEQVDFASALVFNVLVYTAPNSIFEWSLLLRRIFIGSEHFLAFKFLLFCVKNLTENKDPDDHLIKKLLLDCPNERIRIAFVDVLVAALDTVSASEVGQEAWPTKASSAFEYPMGKSVACLVLSMVQRLIDISRKSWMTFRQFWEVNYFSVQLGLEQRRYFRDLINVFSDYKQYYMNQSSGPRRTYSTQSIMDDNHHSDLRVYLDTLRILVCGSENEQREEIEMALGIEKALELPLELRTPYAIPGPLLPPLTKSHKEDIFDYSFFSSMIEMEYNLPATITIIKHISWECPQRSKWVLLIILDEFDRSVLHKQIVFCDILSHLLALEDSLQEQRISWCLTPFPLGAAKYTTTNYSTGKTTGLLGHLKNSPKFLIHFLMHLQSTNTGVRDYLRDRRSELLWMRDSLVSVMENENLPIPTIEDSAEIGDIVIPIPARNTTIEVPVLFTSLCGLIRYGGSGTSDNGEVLELLRKMEVLEVELRNQKKEGDRMKLSLQGLIGHFKQMQMDPPPESIDISMIEGSRSNWKRADEQQADDGPPPLEPVEGPTQGPVHAGPVPDPDENDPEIVISPLPNLPKLPNTPAPSSPASQPKDAAEKIASLVDIFGFDPDVLKVALKHNNWNTDQTAIALFEPDNVTYNRQPSGPPLPVRPGPPTAQQNYNSLPPRPPPNNQPQYQQNNYAPPPLPPQNNSYQPPPLPQQNQYQQPPQNQYQPPYPPSNQYQQPVQNQYSAPPPLPPQHNTQPSQPQNSYSSPPPQFPPQTVARPPPPAASSSPYPGPIFPSSSNQPNAYPSPQLASSQPVARPPPPAQSQFPPQNQQPAYNPTPAQPSYNPAPPQTYPQQPSNPQPNYQQNPTPTPSQPAYQQPPQSYAPQQPQTYPATSYNPTPTQKPTAQPQPPQTYAPQQPQTYSNAAPSYSNPNPTPNPTPAAYNPTPVPATVYPQGNQFPVNEFPEPDRGSAGRPLPKSSVRVLPVASDENPLSKSHNKPVGFQKSALQCPGCGVVFKYKFEQNDHKCQTPAANVHLQNSGDQERLQREKDELFRQQQMEEQRLKREKDEQIKQEREEHLKRQQMEEQKLKRERDETKQREEQRLKEEQWRKQQEEEQRQKDEQKKREEQWKQQQIDEQRQREEKQREEQRLREEQWKQQAEELRIKEEKQREEQRLREEQWKNQQLEEQRQKDEQKKREEQWKQQQIDEQRQREEKLREEQRLREDQWKQQQAEELRQREEQRLREEQWKQKQMEEERIKKEQEMQERLRLEREELSRQQMLAQQKMESEKEQLRLKEEMLQKQQLEHQKMQEQLMLQQQQLQQQLQMFQNSPQQQAPQPQPPQPVQQVYQQPPVQQPYQQPPVQQPYQPQPVPVAQPAYQQPPPQQPAPVHEAPAEAKPQCASCGKVFKFKFEENNHQCPNESQQNQPKTQNPQNPSNNSEAKHQCPGCNQIFKFKYEQNSHQCSNPSAQVPTEKIECTGCGKVFKFRYEQNSHQCSATLMNEAQPKLIFPTNPQNHQNQQPQAYPAPLGPPPQQHVAVPPTSYPPPQYAQPVPQAQPPSYAPPAVVQQKPQKEKPRPPKKPLPAPKPKPAGSNSAGSRIPKFPETNIKWGSDAYGGPPPPDVAPPNPIGLQIAQQFEENGLYNAVDQLAFNFPEVDSHIALAHALVASPLCTSEYHKARVIYSWVATHIAEEESLLQCDQATRDSRRQPESVYRFRTAICEGVSNLFMSMARAVGLQVWMICGLARLETERMIALVDPAHVWNAIKIDGNYFPLDCFWARKKGVNGEVTFFPFYFLTSPNQFIFSHFPLNQKWQLLPEPFVKEPWDNVPFTGPYCFLGGFQFISHVSNIIETHAGSMTHIQIAHEPGWHVDVQLKYFQISGGRLSGVSVLDQNVTIQACDPAQSELRQISILTPYEGIYAIIVWGTPLATAVDSLTSQQPYSFGGTAIEYQVIASSRPGQPESPISSFPTFYGWFHFCGLYVMEPLSGVLRANSQVTFKIGQIQPLLERFENCKFSLKEDSKDWSELVTLEVDHDEGFFFAKVNLGMPGPLYLCVAEAEASLTLNYAAVWTIQ